MDASLDEEDVSDLPNQQCKIRFPRKTSKKAPVFLTDFSHGKLNRYHDGHIKFECYREVEDDSDHRIIVADGGRIHYSGSSFGDEAEERNKHLQYMVGVRSKSTGKMKLFHSVFFHLKPVLSEPSEEAEVSVIEHNKSLQEKRDDLTSNFGSKIGKKTMTSRLKYSMKAEDTASPLSQELECLSVEDHKTSEKAIVKNTTPMVLPPQNKNTSEVANVYSINDIISEEEYIALKTEAEALLAASDAEILQWKNDKLYCNYVMFHLENVELNSLKAHLLVYYNYLVSFGKLTFSDIRRKDPAPDIPEPFKQIILQNYTFTTRQESGRIIRSLPLAVKDKLLAYSLVLALFIDDFSVNLDLVQSDMKTAITKLTKISQALGCHISNQKVQDSAVKFAVLRLPLYVIPQGRYIKNKKNKQ